MKLSPTWSNIRSAGVHCLSPAGCHEYFSIFSVPSDNPLLLFVCNRPSFAWSQETCSSDGLAVRKKLVCSSRAHGALLTLEGRFAKSTELRPRALECTEPRGTSESETQNVTWAWRKLRNEELHNPYSSSHVSKIITPKRNRWEWGAWRAQGEGINIYKIFVGNLEKKKLLARSGIK
jgi:hypothetical protein